MTYIWERENWTAFTWDAALLAQPLRDILVARGRLMAKLELFGLETSQNSNLEVLTSEIQASSEIEGEYFRREDVRSSVARRLGLEIGSLLPADRHVDGVVEMSLDATGNAEAPLTKDRIFDWHRLIFPEGRSGITKIRTGSWRDDREGRMRVISDSMGRERVHYEAPPAERIDGEIAAFLEWFERRDPLADPIIKSALAHFRFVTIHPFEDGNGRIARAIADLALARGERGERRAYSMSAQIRKDRKNYYETLEGAQKGDRDLTQWLFWYVGRLTEAISEAENALATVRNRAVFWERANRIGLNGRQRAMLTRMLDGFEGKMTSSKWAQLAKCSQDTAGRDIAGLIAAGLLEKGEAGGRSTGYTVNSGELGAAAIRPTENTGAG